MPPVEGSNTGLYLAIVAMLVPFIGRFIFDIVQWMGKRAVDRADEDQKKLIKRVEDLENQHDAVKENAERRFQQVDHSLVTMQAEMKTVLAQVEGTRGAVAELKSSLENRFEKQAAFYRDTQEKQTDALIERMEKMEHDLRNDMSRSVADIIDRQRGARGAKR